MLPDEFKEKAGRGDGLDREEIAWVLGQEDPALIDEIARLADQVRAKFLGRNACIHGIIEMSNVCRRNCLYCGLRSENAGLERYRLEPEKVIELAETAVKKFGYKMLVLQSGEDPGYSTADLVRIVSGVRERSGALIFLSLGERDPAVYGKLFVAGARGVLFRFETSSPALYREMHPGASFEERIAHLKFMKDIGYIVATGPLIGLPGQTAESCVSDLLSIRELGALMVSMGPFIPHPATPLAGRPSPSPQLVRKMIAAARLAMPRVRIPVTTAMEYLWGDDFRRLALKSGANSFMLNLTPPGVRECYDVYPEKNKLAAHLHSKAAFERVKGVIEDCGMELCRGFGKEFALADPAFSAGCSMDFG